MRRGLIIAFLSACLLPSAAYAASVSVYLSPSATSVQAGSTFTIRALISAPGQAINAASGTLAFPADKLAVQSIDAADSIFDVWAGGPSFSNKEGRVDFAGVVLNPGFSGNRGSIFNVHFKALASGPAAISVASAMVLANDGQGTALPVRPSAPVTMDIVANDSQAAADNVDTSAIRSSGSASLIMQLIGNGVLVLMFVFVVFIATRVHRLEKNAPSADGSAPESASLRKLKKDIDALQNDLKEGVDGKK